MNTEAKSINGSVQDTEKVKVSGKTAYRAHLTLAIKQPDGTSVEVYQGELLIQRGGDVTLVSVATPTAASAVLIDQILGSVRLT